MEIGKPDAPDGGFAKLRSALAAFARVDVNDIPLDAEALAALAAEKLEAASVLSQELDRRAPFSSEEFRQITQELNDTIAELEAGPAGDVRALLSEIREHLAENLESPGEFESEGSTFERGLVERIDAILNLGKGPGEPVRLRYRNWRGEEAVRTITPKKLWHGGTKWHPEPQYLIMAWDHDQGAMRDFALRDFLGQPG